MFLLKTMRSCRVEQKWAGTFLSVALGLTSIFLTESASANYSADIFELGSGRTNKLYELKVKVEETTPANQTLHAVYSDLAGKPVFEEKTIVQNGQIQKVEIQQHQLGQSAQVEVKGGKIFFALTKDGRTSVDSEKLEEPFVMSGGVARFIQSKWSDLMAGKPVSLRYGVWYRQDTVGFEFKKVGESGAGENRRVILKYQPTSFIIKALVDPIEFVMNHDGSQILELRGRVAPKLKKGNDYVDLDAEMVYRY